MYAAKREGGQCIRSFVPDLPFPYTFPEFNGSAISGIRGRVAASDYQGAAGTSRPADTTGNETTTLAPALRPISEVATPTPDQPNDTPKGIRWPPTAVRVAMAVLGAGVIAFTASSVFNADAGHSVFFADFLYPALNLSAAALIAVRAYRIRAERFAWILIAAGMTSSAMGDVVYALWVPDGQSPSAADPEYLAFYPLVYAGLLLLMRARWMQVPAADMARFPGLRADHGRGGRGLDGRADPRGRDSGTGNRAGGSALSVGRSGPAGSGRWHAANPRWRNEFRWALLVAGFVGFAVADTAYLFQTAAGSYRVGSVLDAFWPASSLLVAMASWAPASPVVPLPRRGFSPYVEPVACTVVALGVAVLGHNSRFAVTLAALSLVAIAARFAVTFRDVSMLAESHKHAMTDELTALPNRRSLATALTATSDPPVGGARVGDKDVITSSAAVAESL